MSSRLTFLSTGAPALVCKALSRYEIDETKCPGCMLCLKACPTDAIIGERKKPHRIDQSKCIQCGNCMEVCPPKVSAVHKVPALPALEAPRPRAHV